MGIQDFLKGKVVFVTGATGFLGQPLVEKLLFCAPGIKRIHVLIRPQSRLKGRVINAQARLEKDLYRSSVFDRLRGSYGDEFEGFLREKLHAVSGDISKDNLGLESEDLARLRSEVDIVINSAAVVSFDAPIDQALKLNVFSAGKLAEFAKSCKEAILIHISTAYVSGATHKLASETMYHSAPDGEEHGDFPKGMFRDVQKDIEHIQKLMKEIRLESESPEQDRKFKRTLVKQARKPRRRRVRSFKGRVDSLRKQWIQEQLINRGMSWARERGWNDTYTYTKAMGEQMVLASRGDLPTVILRPSIIESSLWEPSPGWLDGLRMADPLIAAIGKGRLRSLPLDPNVLLDLVPVDVVVNACLASIPKIAKEGGVKIYQVATGSQNPITLGELNDLIFTYFRKHPMPDKKGRPIRIRPLKFPNPATFRLQHHIKRVPLDTAEKTLERLKIFESTQRVRRRVSAVRLAHQKLYYYGEIYEPYLNLDCQFQVDKTMELFKSLTEEEQKVFNFDVTRVNWRHYIQNVHIPGIKKYILKMEGVGTMELAADISALPFSTITELVDYGAGKHGEKTAVQIERDGKWVRYSYSDMKKYMEEIASRFRRLGFRKGDRVILFSENQPEWGLAYLGASAQGLIVVPIDAQTWHREVWSVAKFTDARAILASEKCLARLTAKGLKQNEDKEQPINLLNVNAFCQPFDLEEYPRSSRPEFNKNESPAPQICPDDPASIIFTTGTAVDPRGAVHTHRNFLGNLYSVNCLLPVGPDDAMLSVLPLYHALEFTGGFLAGLYCGATVTYMQTLKPRLILKTMREVGTTCLMAVPTFFALLRDDIERRVLKTKKSGFKSNLMSTSKHLSKTVERSFGRNIGRRLFAKVHEEFGGKIRMLVSGGSALGEELYEDFKALGMPIYEGYGLTETAPVITVSPHNLSRRGSAGKPIPGVEVRLDHPDGEGVGEIVVRSPSLMTEYYKNPRATREMVEDGWLRTGDLGWVDVDGYIYITGRKKNVIVTGAGKNVYVEDVEAIYKELDSVGDLGVVGIKKGLTEEVHAVVEPSDSISEEVALARAAIQAEVRVLAKELPSYHRLQQIHVWPEGLPRDETGALNRRELREKLLGQLDIGRGPGVDDGTRRFTKKDRLIAELGRLSQLPVEQIHEDSDLYTDLGLDSLKAIELLLFLEHEFNISVSDETAASFHKVSEVILELRRLDKEEGQITAGLDSGVPSSAHPLEARPFLDRLILRSSFNALRIFFRTYFRMEVDGHEVIPRKEAFIVAANHNSHLDSGAIIAALNIAKGRRQAYRLHVLGARDYFFKSKLKGWLVSRLLNVVPIERREASLSSLRLVKGILENKESVLIFPEGTRSRSGEMQEFKAGLGLMAWEADTTIIPAFIDGTAEAMPVGKVFPRPKKIRVHFGEPVSMGSYNAEDWERKDLLYRQIVEDVRGAVQEAGD